MESGYAWLGASVPKLHFNIYLFFISLPGIAALLEMDLNKFGRDVVLGSNSTFRVLETPFWSVAVAGQAINLTVPGTPPYKVHSSFYDAYLNQQLSYWQHLPGNLSSNTFVWTPEFQEGSRNRPTTEGNETDFRPKYEEGDSVIWAFTEMQGDWDSPGVESNVYISGNFTIMTQEMADQQDPKYRENHSENGAFTSKASLKGIVIAGLFTFAMIL